MAYLGWAIYNLGILGGTAYLVQAHDWSPWWFLLTVLLVANLKGKE
jgi:hypothetical protein